MIIGSRESKLAMRQTDIFMEQMKAAGSTIPMEVKGLTSLGDVDLTSPLNSLGDIGAFVRELDDALLRKEIDISVNSMKDIPIDLPKGLVIGAVLKRDDTHDICVPSALDELPQGSRVGTSSVRRENVLKTVRPDIEILPIRGNIHTRLDKLDNGEYDAIILAKAGFDRMGITRSCGKLDENVFVPSPAQGAIAVECREDDVETLELLKAVDHEDTRREVNLERNIMKLMNAGCSSPVGIRAYRGVGGFTVKAVSFTDDGKPIRLTREFKDSEEESNTKEIAEILKIRK